MKKLKYILPLITGLMICTSSCDLDEINPSGATAENIWGSTPENFVTAVNAAYDQQRWWYGRDGGLYVTEAGTDLWFNRDKRLWSSQLSAYVNFDDNVNFLNNAWANTFKGINHCNAGIGRINDVEWPSEGEKNKRLGELRFMRAFYLWHIVEHWGGVMLKTQETKTVELNLFRSPVESFYDVILSDLEFATEHLPNEAEWGDQWSRATKAAAWGFLAKANLSRAYYGDGQQYFEAAKDAANEIISRQVEFGLSLWDNYGDLWKPENNRENGRRNREAIYTVTYSRSGPALNYDNNGNRMHQYFVSAYSGRLGLQLSLEYGRDGGRLLMPSLALLDFFDEEKDSRYHGSFKEAWICNTENDFIWTAEAAATWNKDASVVGQVIRTGIDTAMLITKKRITDKATKPYVIYDRDDVYDPATGAIRTGLEFVTLKKFLDPITRAGANAQPGFLDVIVMRLPEIYLIAAEAEFQLNNPQAAADHINVLRTRAAIKTPVDYTNDMQVSSSDIDLDFILDERARELCGENMRWHDLKRTRTLGPRIERFNPDITEFRDHHNLRPIPRIEMDAMENASEFGQNQGYGGW